MLMLKQSKKAVAPLFIILGIVLVLLIIYLLLLLPIPLFKSIRIQINYFLVLIFWILFQLGLIFAYFNIGKYAVKGFAILKTKVIDWSINIRHLIIRHS